MTPGRRPAPGSKYYLMSLRDFARVGLFRGGGADFWRGGGDARWAGAGALWLYRLCGRGAAFGAGLLAGREAGAFGALRLVSFTGGIDRGMRYPVAALGFDFCPLRFAAGWLVRTPGDVTAFRVDLLVAFWRSGLPATRFGTGALSLAPPGSDR